MHEYSKFINNLDSQVYHGIGPYDIPEIKGETEYRDVEWTGFSTINTCNDGNGKGIHFYLDDYMFDRVWADLDENLNISDFNPYIANGYQRTVIETIALAKNLGIPIINMHLSCGVYFTLPDRKVYLFSEYREQYLKSITDFRQICESEIGKYDITICIENCDGFLSFQKEALRILLDSPVFGLTFDIGHDHACGGVDEPYIMANKSRLCHMHMHDALGKKNHLTLGAGELDVAKYCALAAEQHCRVVLETKTIEGLRQSVNWMRLRAYTESDRPEMEV